MASFDVQKEEMKVGDRAMILVKPNGLQSSRLERKRVLGTIKFIGPTHFADGEWVGLLLDRSFEDHAKNDGSVQNTRYFDTGGETLGLFVRSQGIRLVDKKDHSQTMATEFRQREDMLSDLENMQAQLEVSEVERQVLVESNNNLEKQLQVLKLKTDAIHLLKAHNEQITEESLKTKMLETELLQEKESFAEKELELYQYISKLEEELVEIRNKLSTVETQFETALTSLEKYEEENKDLIERLNVLQPGSAEEIIEKLTEQTTEYTNKISKLEETVNMLKKKEAESTEFEKEYVLTIENLNNVIKELEEQFEIALSKCTILETQLKDSSDMIKSLKLKINTEPISTSASNIFYGVLKLSDNRFFNVLRSSQSPNESIAILKKIIIIDQIALKLIETVSNIDKWKEFSATCTVYINCLVFHPKPIFQSVLADVDTFLNKFWMYLEETDYLDLICGIDVPFGWNNSYSEVENELITREKLIYLSHDTNILHLRDTNQGISINSYCLELIASWDAKIINVDFKRLTVIDLIKIDTIPKVITNDDDVRNLKHKIQALQIKIKDDQELQQELNVLRNDLESQRSKKYLLESDLENANLKMHNLTSKYSSVVSLMKKLGLNTKNDMYEPIINDYEVIDKVNLLTVIDTQRNIITKLSNTETTFESESYKWLREWPESVKREPTGDSRRIEKLFEINTDTKIGLHHSELKIIRYLAK